MMAASRPVEDKEIDEANALVKRSRITLLTSTGLYAAGTGLLFAGLGQCDEYDDECSNGLLTAGSFMVLTGAVTMLTSGIMLGVRKARRRRLHGGGRRMQYASAGGEASVSQTAARGRSEEPDPLEGLRMDAADGDADAQFALGLSYAKGEDVEQDFSEAVRWTSMAAGQGHAGAQTNLGSAYYNGQGVARDRSKAAEWYRKAAEQGDARAQFSLGYMYAKGEGVLRDSAQAAEWYRRAAEQDFAPAVAAQAALQDLGSTAAAAR